MNRLSSFLPGTLLVLALAMVPFPKSLAAVACGDFVGGTVVLSANLDCSGAGGYTAIGIGADNTVIELNGHTLSGGRDLMGVDVSSYNNVTIRGPGVIRGFWLGVRAGNGRGLTVEGVRFDDLGMGISDNHGQDAVILENEFFNMDFHGIQFATVAAGQPDSTGGLVRDNSFDGGGTAIELCGMQTYGHNISRNRIQNQSHFGIVLSDQTHHNRIVGNDVDNSYGGLALFNAQRNRIIGDRYTSGTLGVWMYSQPPGSCLNTGLRRVNGNRLNGMSLFELQTAVQFGGDGVPGSVRRNQFLDSKVYNNERGLVFASDSRVNTATGNALFGTVLPIQDSGTANTTSPNFCDLGPC